MPAHLEAGSGSASASVRLADCPPQLAHALRGLDAGDGTVSCLAVEAALRPRSRTRASRGRLLAALLVAVGVLMLMGALGRASHSDGSLAQWRLLSECTCPPDAADAEEEEEAPAPSPDPPADAPADEGEAAADLIPEPSPGGEEAADDGDLMSFDLEFPELFAYVWVLGGGASVTVAVYLFIHRSNALTALPCCTCLRG